MQRDSVQPIWYRTFAPLALRLEWACVCVYLTGLASLLFVLRAGYFGKRDGRGWRITPRWRITRLALILCMFVDVLLWETYKLRAFRPLRPLLLVLALPNLRHYAQMVITSTWPSWDSTPRYRHSIRYICYRCHIRYVRYTRCTSLRWLSRRRGLHSVSSVTDVTCVTRVTPRRHLWGLFLLVGLVLAYFTLYGAFFFGNDACTCEPPCNASQLVPIVSDSPW